MGLLDDAIREHLELKRKHGANPDDVARQEQEALGPGHAQTSSRRPEGRGAGTAAAVEPSPSPEPEPDAGAGR